MGIEHWSDFGLILDTKLRVFLFWLIFHSNIGRWRRLGRKAYLVACASWPLVSGPLLFYRERLFSIRWEMPLPVVLLGFVALVWAVRIGVQASRTISGRTLVGLPELQPDRNPQPLIQRGIYSKTRNPVYFTHWLLIFSGAAITGFAANWGLLAVALVGFPWMLHVEENELRARFGSAFDDYARRVPRFFPKWPPW